MKKINIKLLSTIVASVLFASNTPCFSMENENDLVSPGHLLNSEDTQNAQINVLADSLTESLLISGDIQDNQKSDLANSQSNSKGIQGDEGCALVKRQSNSFGLLGRIFGIGHKQGQIHTLDAQLTEERAKTETLQREFRERESALNIELGRLSGVNSTQQAAIISLEENARLLIARCENTQALFHNQSNDLAESRARQQVSEETAQIATQNRIRLERENAVLYEEATRAKAILWALAVAPDPKQELIKFQRSNLSQIKTRVEELRASVIQTEGDLEVHQQRLLGLASDPSTHLANEITVKIDGLQRALEEKKRELALLERQNAEIQEAVNNTYYIAHVKRTIEAPGKNADTIWPELLLLANNWSGSRISNLETDQPTSFVEMLVSRMGSKDNVSDYLKKNGLRHATIETLFSPLFTRAVSDYMYEISQGANRSVKKNLSSLTNAR